MTNIHSTLDDLIVPIDGLKHYGKNPRKGDVSAIAESLAHNGQYKPIVVRAGTNEVLAGNHTLKAAKELGWDKIAVTFVDVTNDQAARIVLVDNRTNDLAGYDDDQLRELLESLPDLAGTGFSPEDLEEYTDSAEENIAAGSLVEKFGAPPFSVLDARQKAWKDRKAAWKSLGINSELGRDEELVFNSPQTQFSNWYEIKALAEREHGALSGKEIIDLYGDRLQRAADSSTSVFDPVLTELMYRWFCPPAGHVLDPWAGGSVRGLVAARLGRQYTGIELREEQVQANRTQLDIANGPLPAFLAAGPGGVDREGHDDHRALVENPEPYWLVGDSTTRLQELPAEQYDMIIGCPPYYDLEVYSDDPKDMSNLAPADFDRAMIANVQAAADRLKPDSYAVFVVGAVRNKRGHLMDMRSLMVRAAGAAGLTLHNDAFLLTPVGTLAVRAGRSFTATRVLARTHQDVLIFLKGDRKRAAQRCSDIETRASLDALDLVEVADNGEDGE